jgi:hypothetical protein
VWIEWRCYADAVAYQCTVIFAPCCLLDAIFDQDKQQYDMVNWECRCLVAELVG